MKNKQIAGGAVLSYGAIIFNIVAGLIYTPWMMHTVGDDKYALYTLALSVINSFLMDFGIGASVSKFLSNYYAEGKYEQANRFMGIVYKVFIVVSSVIALCLFIFYFLIDGIYVKLTPGELAVFKHLFIIVASYSVLSFPFISFNGALMANEEFIGIKACNFGQRVFNVLLIVAVLLCGGGVYALVLCHAASNVVFIVVKYVLIRKRTRLKADFSCRDHVLTKELFGFSVWITVSNLAQRCIFNIMPSVIAAVTGAAEVTLFSLAATLEGYVYSFADGINGMFLPKISRILVGDSAEDKLTLLMGKVGRFHVATIGLLYIGFLLVGREFVQLWMGAGYEAVYFCAALLIFPSIIDVPQQVARTALLAKDVVREQAVVYTGMAVINIALSFVLLRAMGIVGAALSICVAYLFRTFAFNVLYRRKLGIDLKEYFKNTYTRWLAAIIPVVAMGVMLGSVDAPQLWVMLGVKALVLAVLYALSFFAVGLKKQERNVILGYICKGDK